MPDDLPPEPVAPRRSRAVESAPPVSTQGAPPLVAALEQALRYARNLNASRWPAEVLAEHRAVRGLLDALDVECAGSSRWTGERLSGHRLRAPVHRGVVPLRAVRVPGLPAPRRRAQAVHGQADGAAGRRTGAAARPVRRRAVIVGTVCACGARGPHRHCWAAAAKSATLADLDSDDLRAAVLAALPARVGERARPPDPAPTQRRARGGPRVVADGEIAKTAAGLQATETPHGAGVPPNGSNGNVALSGQAVTGRRSSATIGRDRERPEADREVPPIALGPNEAAAALGLSVDSFRRYVVPDVRCIRRGSIRLYPVAELERWADEQAEQLVDG